MWSASYDSFGKATVDQTSSITNNLRFPGQYFDVETGLHYNYFRNYDPVNGRYLESDPIGLSGGVNRYVYVLSNPMLLVDPDGLECISMPAIPYQNCRQISYKYLGETTLRDTNSTNEIVSEFDIVLPKVGVEANKPMKGIPFGGVPIHPTLEIPAYVHITIGVTKIEKLKQIISKSETTYLCSKDNVCSRDEEKMIVTTTCYGKWSVYDTDSEWWSTGEKRYYADPGDPREIKLPWFIFKKK